MTTPNSHSAQTATEGYDEMLEHFMAQFKGGIIRPGNDLYDQERAVWNGMIDKRPAIIAQCTDTADVVAAVNFARESNLPFSVRGGGHNVAGNAVIDHGLVIDLSQMKAISVNPENHTVRAQGGATIGDLDLETQEHHLAVPLGVASETGIAGLTLGGGMGWMRRKYGLSCDNLIGAELVTADGRIITASETQNPDLLWGLRGGGGNFGIVTTFEYRAYPLGPDVYFAAVFYPAENMKAGLQFYRQFTADAPDEISSFAILWSVPGSEDFPAHRQGEPMLVFLAVYTGPPEDGERALQPLRDFAEPIADFSGVWSYLDVQQFFDEDYPSGELHYYWKSRYLNNLDDDAIVRLIALHAENPSHHSTIDIWQLGGAMSRVGAEETAFGRRDAPFLLGIESNWEKTEDDAANINWNRKVFREMAPFSDGNEYLNFPGFYEDNEKMVRDTFGSNYQRLVTLKQKYDPDNLFNMNQNIKPSV